MITSDTFFTPHSSYRFFAPMQFLASSVFMGVCCFLLFFLVVTPQRSYGFDFGSLVDDVGSAVKKGADIVEDSVKDVLPGEEDESKPQQQKQQTSPSTTKQVSNKESEAKSELMAKSKGGASTPSPTGGSLFSTGPINPSSPPAGTQSFTAGDNVYGILKASKSWKLLNRNSNYLLLYFFIDGKQKAYKSVGMRRPELLERDYVIIDIAPLPSEMTNYSDRDIVFPEKDGYKFGPELFTKYLSELPPGTHSIRLEVKAYNKVFASGSFTISGDDFSVYSPLLAEIKNSGGKLQTMPRPGMNNQTLNDTMAGLLRNDGWTDIRRLLIVDKDWWLDRVSGGDSPIKSRHIEAAAAGKNTDGSFYFQRITFLQPKLITGEWGKLAISHRGKKTMILEENINK